MIDILRVLETRDNYSRYYSIIKRMTTDIDINKILYTINKYYSTSSNINIVWHDFRLYFHLANPKLTETQEIVFKNIFDSLCSPVIITSVESLLTILLERYYAERIAYLGMEVAEGRRSSLTSVRAEFDAYLRESKNAAPEQSEAVTEDLNELLAEVAPGSGLKWRLPHLNTSLGELPPGRFILFGARPDGGKTSMLCSEGSYMAQQLPEGKKVLYFCNEESGREVKRRWITSTLGVTLNDLEKDPTLHWKNYCDIMGKGDEEKITIINKQGLSATDVERWLDKGNVGLVLFDQLRKLKGFDKEAGVGKLESIFNLAREWAKEYAPLINVSQLGDNADNIAYPGVNTLYESRTAAQGETDAIINIGWVNGSIPTNARYLNIVRNKLPHPGDPDRRLGKYECLLNSDKARFEV